MKTYLNILKNILENGTPKQPVRRDHDGNIVPVENGTIGTFCEIFRHNMSDGFPLITTKKMAFKTFCVELEGFIKGITDKQWFKDRGCKIWNEWANPRVVDELYNSHCNIDPITGQKIKTKKEIQLEENDLGPIYGYQWRDFAASYNTHQYDDCDFCDYHNGVLNGYDQLKSICDQLKANPYDRRMVCSAWNPNQMNMMALPACHVMFNVVVYGNKLNLVWFQRSNDIFLGNPANIMSYALLLLILAKHANLEPGELVGTFNDCHIYNNQIEQAKLQLTREPYPLPQLVIKDNKEGGFDPLKWEYDDVELLNYQCHPSIKAEVTV